jgi:hypothetical protein
MYYEDYGIENQKEKMFIKVESLKCYERSSYILLVYVTMKLLLQKFYRTHILFHPPPRPYSHQHFPIVYFI